MRKIFACITLLISAINGYSNSPLWMRDVQISPSGQQIVFCYKGDIYTVPTTGGAAKQLTTQQSYEQNPIWSPDEKQIAFASDRNGNFDLFVMPSAGGSAKRLTKHSTNEIPSAFTPDGSAILFSATIQDPASSALYPVSAMSELYKVNIANARVEQVLGTPAEAVSYSQTGDFFVYQDRKGFENEWRKHHTSSITRDIWMYHPQSKKHTNLTNRAGEDRNPVLSANSQTVYYLSEREGSFNVYSFPINNPQNIETITNFQTHPVRFLSVAQNGTLCYTYDGEIYTQQPNGTPQKVNVSIVRDDEFKVADLNFTSGATSATASPDGKQVAFIVRGEVFVTSTNYNTTKQITHTPERETGLSFAPDNRTLAYASERNGNWQLYLAKIARKEELNFPNATQIEEEVILPSLTIERAYPTFSPDGKELAFIEDRNKLMVLNLATQKVRQITDGSTWYSTSGGFNYQWSPDGKWFALDFIGNKHEPYSDIGLVSAQGGGEITNLTNSGYASGSPRWALDGQAILFTTERYGMRAHASWGSQEDAMLVFLNQDAYDKYSLSKEDYELQKELKAEQEKSPKQGSSNKKADSKKGKTDPKKDKSSLQKEDSAKVNTAQITVELEHIEDRMVRLTPASTNLGDVLISKDGETLFYLVGTTDGYEMWKMDLRKKETKLIHKLNTGWAAMELDKEGKNLFLLGSKAMQKMEIGSSALKPVTYRAEMKMDLAAEREYMFNHVYKQQQKRFYEVNMHGVNWDEMTDAYRKFLPHIDNNYDFAELLSEWLGELNVSHTGGSFSANSGGDRTANLGILFDWNYQGKGIRMDEIIEKGPFDRANSKAKAGVVIEKINGHALTQAADYFALLNNQEKKKTLVSLYNPQTGARWEEVVLPISGGALNDLLYKRWVKQRAADVEKWSNGQLGYVHIQSMGDDSFRSVYSDILGKYNNCEGIVIDTRFNGGGRLHEDIEILFSGRKYLTQVMRGRESCDMPSRRWNKPSIMLMCEANYSNAHGTPWVYSQRQMGKLVGMPVPGTMTSVTWERLQDPSLVFGIPTTGYRLADGSYLENQQLEPDVKVANSPETLVEGEDIQLKTAVEELLKEIRSN